MTRPSRKEREAFYAQPWAGKNRHYDIFKEGAIAFVVVGVLVVAFAALFSSPDDKTITFKQWATDSPDTFYATTVSQLAGTSETAGYGAPYNEGSDGLTIGPLALQKWGGIAHPVDAAQDFVITPLTTTNPGPLVTVALTAWTSATPDQQAAWATAYDDAVQATADDAGDLHLDAVEAGDYGPVPALAKAATDIATTGGYDNALTGQGEFFQTDQTKQLLMMGDGGFMEDKAVAHNLGGDQWGMMNEAGDWPGQIWLSPWSFWYQLPAFNAEGTTLGDNADAIITAIMVVLFLIFLFLPFIPGLREIPRLIPFHRLVWKSYYKEHGRV
jgi:hypothetical protein